MILYEKIFIHFHIHVQSNSRAAAIQVLVIVFLFTRRTHEVMGLHQHSCKTEWETVWLVHKNWEWNKKVETEKLESADLAFLSKELDHWKPIIARCQTVSFIRLFQYVPQNWWCLHSLCSAWSTCMYMAVSSCSIFHFFTVLPISPTKTWSESWQGIL